jgi:methylenetetrahydrofolate--tRNA-(uracil-5-)-methyltransferase
MSNEEVIVIGGGLSGTEAAWQIAEKGFKVKLYEMRPVKETGAHTTGFLGELVCSNSLGSNLPDRASGLLKSELRLLNSMVLRVAENNAVPAGGALAVDRDGFAKEITSTIENHPNIELIREEVVKIPDGNVVIASGPLTSEKLSDDISKLAGEDHLYFFDAISPIVSLESINFDIAYRGSRYDKDSSGEGDYINCPFTKEEYYQFVNALTDAERIELKSFETVMESGVKAGAHTFFEGCLPVEIIAKRGVDSLAYGPMRPVGLIDPRTGRRPFAVVQLRQDDLAGSLYNLVGYQTNLKFQEQKRVFRMIPGLEKAEFLRYGQMHRNTFIFSPKLLHSTMEFRNRKGLFFAGQITGIEGYIGNIASGVLAGLNMVNSVNDVPLLEIPINTMLGSLTNYISKASQKDFQPMKANFGIVPPITDGVRRKKRERARYYAERSIDSLKEYLNNIYAHSH